MADSPIAAAVTNLSRRAQTLFRNASRTELAITAVVIATGLPLVRYIQHDYANWYALGKGGVPHNATGYVLVKILGLLGSSDVYGTACYDKMAARSTREATSFFDHVLPERSGVRPKVSRWIAPVRQLSHASPENLIIKLETSIKGLVGLNSTVIQARPSTIEGGGQTSNALFITHGHEEHTRLFAKRGPNETYHFHPSEGSGHAMLSAADCKTIIEQKWGERHPLAGAPVGGLPINYVMIYAPRTEDEIAVHEAIARAASRYALRGKELLK